jgi:hypothetical protein
VASLNDNEIYTKKFHQVTMTRRKEKKGKEKRKEKRRKSTGKVYREPIPGKLNKRVVR